MFDGPWGDGGGAAAREYGRQFAAEGLVVFLPDYFTGRHSEDSISGSTFEEVRNGSIILCCCLRPSRSCRTISSIFRRYTKIHWRCSISS